MFPPERIVCLTEETVETLYLLGEQDRAKSSRRNGGR
jgi:ABC-type Fe3+-hydroxamate transport system substrate-binding protein